MRELLDMCIEEKVYKSNKKGNCTLQLKWSDSVSFDNLEETKEDLTSYYFPLFSIEKIHKCTMFTVMGCMVYNLHFRTSIDIKEGLHEDGIGLCFVGR